MMIQCVSLFPSPDARTHGSINQFIKGCDAKANSQTQNKADAAAADTAALVQPFCPGVKSTSKQPLHRLLWLRPCQESEHTLLPQFLTSHRLRENHAHGKSPPNAIG